VTPFYEGVSYAHVWVLYWRGVIGVTLSLQHCRAPCSPLCDVPRAHRVAGYAGFALVSATCCNMTLETLINIGNLRRTGDLFSVILAGAYLQSERLLN
jgi:hypothetical protein